MELFIFVLIVVWFWLLLKMRSVKKQLELLQRRFTELNKRLSRLEHPLVPRDTRSALDNHRDSEQIVETAKPKSTAKPPIPSNFSLSETTLTDKESARQTVDLAVPSPQAGRQTSDIDIDGLPDLENMDIDSLLGLEKAQQQAPALKYTAKPTSESINKPISKSIQQTAAQDIPERSPVLWEKGRDYAKTWLTTGNIPVKIGMLVLIAAVIAFLRYATNQGWLRVPIEYKLLGTAAAAVAALVFAWYKRHSKRSFSLSVQGGSIGILLLVIFAAVKMYGLLSPNVGFALSVPAVLLAAVLALQQDAKALAIMAILAGFLAPIWLSDGSGRHVILFSYYAILNVGIFIIAWLKPWRELNLLGFIFTYVIGSIWGGLRYEPVHFASTEPFVILFFLFYLFIPLRYVHRQGQGDEQYRGKVDSALLFGTPMVTLGLQVGMLYNDTNKLALSCLGIGLVYALLAWVLRGKSVYRTLQTAYTGLAAGFITLAVPIGLSAKATTTIFALEGAGAVWFGTQEKRRLTWLAGILLQLVAAIGFVYAYLQVSDFSRAIFNDYYFNALLIGIAGWVSAWVCYRGGQQVTDNGSDQSLFSTESLYLAARLCFLWGMAWWLGSAIHEILYYAPSTRQLHDISLLFSLTTVAVVLAYRYYRDDWLLASITALIISGLGFAAARLAVVFAWHKQHISATQDLLSVFHPVTIYQVITWVLYAIIGGWTWRQLKNTAHAWIAVAIVAWGVALATTLSTVIYQYLPIEWQTSGYYWWAITAVWLVVIAVLNYRPDVAAWAVQRYDEQRCDAQRWQKYLGIASAVVLLLCFMHLLRLSGNETIWLPLLNSVELLQVTIVGLLFSWLSRYQTENRLSEDTLSIFTYALVIPLVIAITWRMIQHWIGYDGAEIMANLSRFGDWYYLAIYGFWLLLALGTLFITPKYIEQSTNWAIVNRAVLNTIVIMLWLVWVYLLSFPGNAGPLAWIPLLNPLAVLQWSILGLVWLWMQQHAVLFDQSRRSLIVPILILLLISVMTLRFVHHAADIAWDISMFTTAIIQMALTVVWSILGVVSWIVGSKRCSRPIWLLGAVLMSVVLLKLVLIDRGHLGNLYGILSFFAYGLLCVIVGYFAPVPPLDKQNINKNK